jgi:hypothetical protein
MKTPTAHPCSLILPEPSPFAHEGHDDPVFECQERNPINALEAHQTLIVLKKPGQINLRSVIVALETNLTLVECFDAEQNTCKIVAECKLKKILRDALKAFLDTLGEYTLADLVINPKLFYG